MYKAVMNIIVNANKELFKEAKKVCEALRELMKEELEERERAGEKAGERNVKIHLIQTKLSKGKTVESIAEDLEESVENVLKLMKEMN